MGTANYKICPHCGSVNKANTKFCEDCGNKLFSESDIIDGDKYEGKYENSFCIKCGQSLPIGAKYCSNCGNPTEIVNEEKVERETVFEGKIHKCPNCGEILNSFLANCPSCGWEVRDAKATDSVKEFARKLELIEAKKMPYFEGRPSIMKSLLGRDFRDEDDEKAARRDFEKQKALEKETLIKSFVIPNTKEDIYEFAILAMSNMSTDDDSTEVWVTKLEQAHKKARILFEDTYEFKQIDRLYIEYYEQQQKKTQRKFRRSLFCGILCITGILVFIIGYFLGSASGDEDSPFYMMGMMGFLVMEGGALLYLMHKDK